MRCREDETSISSDAKSSMDGGDETSISSDFDVEAAVVADVEEHGAGIKLLEGLGPGGRGPWCCYTVFNERESMDMSEDIDGDTTRSMDEGDETRNEEGDAGIKNLKALGPGGRGPWCCFTVSNGEDVPFAWYATPEEARQRLRELEFEVEEEWRVQLERQAWMVTRVVARTGLRPRDHDDLIIPAPGSLAGSLLEQEFSHARTRVCGWREAAAMQRHVFLQEASKMEA